MLEPTMVLMVTHAHATFHAKFVIAKHRLAKLVDLRCECIYAAFLQSALLELASARCHSVL